MKFHDECDLLKTERRKCEKARDYTYAAMAVSGFLGALTLVSLGDYGQPYENLVTFIMTGMTFFFAVSAAIEWLKFRTMQAEVYTHADMDHKMKQAKALMDRGKFMVNNEAVHEMFQTMVNEHREHFGEPDETGGEG